MEQVREGCVEIKNPFNPSQVRRCSLLPQDVDIIVFWSKNPAPLMPYLDELDSMGYRYYFQFTLNDYPKLLEPNLPPLEERIGTFKEISRKLGPAGVVWRWDPIVISTVTPPAYHVERLERIAAMLEGCSERLIISFMDFYAKTVRRLDALTKESGISFTDIAAPDHRDEILDLACSIAGVARRHGFEVSTCAEEVDLSSAGIPHGACIDADQISRLLGREVTPRKHKGQRTHCLCVESVDIGTYNTCTNGCVYCYAGR